MAIDRTSKRTFAELHPEATTVRAADCWRRVVAAVPYAIHQVWADNGVTFTHLPHHQRPRPHLFDAVYAPNMASSTAVPKKHHYYDYLNRHRYF